MKTSRFSVLSLLAFGFGLACSLLAAVIVLGFMEQARLNDITTSIAQDQWPKIELVTKVQLDVTDVAVALRNLVIADRQVVREAESNEILRIQGLVNSDLAALKKRVITPTGVANLARVADTIRAYRAGQDALMALMQEGRDEEARRYLNIELKPLLKACRDSLAEQVRQEAAQMDSLRAEAARLYVSTRLSMLALGGLALIGSGLVATLIVVRLQRALGGPPEVAAQTAARIAKGDLTGAIELRGSDRVSMMYEMEHMREELGRLVGGIRLGTDQITAASAQIAAGNRDLSSRTEQQAASLEETAAAMEQLNATVEQNTAHAQLANRLAQQASRTAGSGRETVSAITTRMQEIADSARQMANIIGMIDDIAFQTNILALNAAVEAARAGEAGRGFAVVASEVRQLAQRSAGAAKQIGTLIRAATEQAQAGAELVHQTENAMADIVASVAKVEDIMRQIGDASAEQHAGIVACSLAVVEMDQGTQQNAVLVEQVSTAAQSLNSKSAQLARAVSRFQINDPQTTVATPAAPSMASMRSGRKALANDS
jgi:methyl-accepting chemotaxis protein